jgi:hypothetical protein
MNHSLRYHDFGERPTTGARHVERALVTYSCAKIAPATRGAAGIDASFVGRLADILDIGCVLLRAIVNSNSRRTCASFCYGL